jgi:hypothetical protein
MISTCVLAASARVAYLLNSLSVFTGLNDHTAYKGTRTCTCLQHIVHLLLPQQFCVRVTCINRSCGFQYARGAL